MTGGETLANGGTPEQAAEAAALGAGGTAALEGTGALAGKAAEGVSSGVSSAWKTATGQKLQNALQDDIRTALGSAAEDAEVSPAASNIRNAHAPWPTLWSRRQMGCFSRSNPHGRRAPRPPSPAGVRDCPGKKKQDYLE